MQFRTKIINETKNSNFLYGQYEKIHETYFYLNGGWLKFRKLLHFIYKYCL